MRRTLCVAHAIAALLAAQSPFETREVTIAARSYTPRLPTSIKVDAGLVEVPVVVRDGQGRAIAGLRRGDFEIRDEGKKRDIRSFVIETSPTLAPSSPTGAGASTPFSTPAAQARARWTALLFDDLNSNAAQLMSARNAAARFLKEGLRPDDRVSVFTTYGRQLVPFTTDAAQITAVLDKISAHPAKADSTGCPGMTAYEAYLIATRTDPNVLDVKVEEARRCSGMPPPRQRRGASGGSGESSADPVVQQVIQLANAVWEQTLAVSRNTLGALSDVVDYLAQFSGDRLLVCASGGFLSGTLETEQDALINRALRKGVVIDSLDAKGLYTLEAPQLGMGAGVRSVIMQSGFGTRPQESANDAIAVLAYGTGGIFFHNNNDLIAGLREMMAPETTYLLGFAPDAPSDGKYHKLKVRLSAGRYELQARPGYVAARTSAAPEAPPRKIDELALASEDRPDPSATVSASAKAASDGSSGLAIALHLDLSHMTFREAFGIRSQRVIFIAILNDAQGNFVTGGEYDIDLALKQATYEKYAAGGFNATALLHAPKGKYRLRGVVDLGNGVMATSTLEVDIP